MMDVTQQNGDLVLAGAAADFCLEATLDCGQAFRWRPLEDGVWEGVALGRHLALGRRGEDIILYHTTPEEYREVWRTYFDLERDYAQVRRQLGRNPTMARAMACCPGVRVLRQDPWEALCTFIISANNNIPRIKGIIQRLCDGWGQELPGTGLRTFPAPEALAGLTPEDLAPVRAGFRTKYILDAAKKVTDGTVDLAAVAALPSPEAALELQKIQGVGIKVAQCALLFGFGRVECVPIDVWIRRVLDCFYPKGMPQYLLPTAGIAQQILFLYVRQNPEVLEKRRGRKPEAQPSLQG